MAAWTSIHATLEVLSHGDIAVIALSSLLICVLATSLAMESAALFVPAFVLVFPAVLPNLTPLGVNEAIGVTLFVMFFGQTSAVSGYLYRRQVDVSLAYRTVLFTVPVAVVGRIVSYAIPPAILLGTFATLLLVLAVAVRREVHTSGPSDKNATTRCRSGTPEQSGSVTLTVPDAVVMATGGGITGLVGLGMGEVANTVLGRKAHVSLYRSVGTATLILYVTVLSATLTNLALVYGGGALGIEPTVPWGLVAIVVPFVLIGGQLGPYVNSRLPETVTARVLVGLYVIVAAVSAVRVFI